jgi:8-hydroxy-5-deazaflavin:NADPH oxidoreductase
MKVAIIGKGNVGTAIGKSLIQKGYEVKFGHRDIREPVAAAAKWGELIILAVPYSAVKDAIKELGSDADGKILIDVTNAISPNGDLAIGFTTSAAEELQKKLPRAKVAKAFNTVFSANQGTGKVGKEQLTFFVASDYPEAKQIVMKLGRDIGFEPVNAGPLRSARYLEPMAMLIINLAYNLGMGTNLGYKLVKG